MAALAYTCALIATTGTSAGTTTINQNHINGETSVIGLIDPDGYETPEFRERVHVIVGKILQERRTMPGIGDFLVPSVVNKDGKVSYWGIFDLAEMPEEDAYLEAEARFYSALKCLGEENVVDFGMVNLATVTMRIEPFRRPPRA